MASIKKFSKNIVDKVSSMGKPIGKGVGRGVKGSSKAVSYKPNYTIAKEGSGSFSINRNTLGYEKSLNSVKMPRSKTVPGNQSKSYFKGNSNANYKVSSGDSSNFMGKGSSYGYDKGFESVNSAAYKEAFKDPGPSFGDGLSHLMKTGPGAAVQGVQDAGITRTLVRGALTGAAINGTIGAAQGDSFWDSAGQGAMIGAGVNVASKGISGMRSAGAFSQISKDNMSKSARSFVNNIQGNMKNISLNGLYKDKRG